MTIGRKAWIYKTYHQQGQNNLLVILTNEVIKAPCPTYSMMQHRLLNWGSTIMTNILCACYATKNTKNFFLIQKLKPFPSWSYNATRKALFETHQEAWISPQTSKVLLSCWHKMTLKLLNQYEKKANDSWLIGWRHMLLPLLKRYSKIWNIKLQYHTKYHFWYMLDITPCDIWSDILIYRHYEKTMSIASCLM